MVIVVIVELVELMSDSEWISKNRVRVAVFDLFAVLTYLILFSDLWYVIIDCLWRTLRSGIWMVVCTAQFRRQNFLHGCWIACTGINHRFEGIDRSVYYVETKLKIVRFPWRVVSIQAKIKGWKVNDIDGRDCFSTEHRHRIGIIIVLRIAYYICLVIRRTLYNVHGQTDTIQCVVPVIFRYVGKR